MRDARKVVWNGTNLAGQQVASGMYLYKMEAGGYTRINQMMLTK